MSIITCLSLNSQHETNSIYFPAKSTGPLGVNNLKPVFHLQMLNWIKENRQEFLLNYSEIGHDSVTAEELEEEHRNFESSCMVSTDKSVILILVCKPRLSTEAD